ncbi:MAG: SEC-C metal-binding domain-containing protein [Desulfobacterales bacterium]|jgi:hypothetical protein
MAKIGRNEPCPCGSGKKFKRCCLTKGVPVLSFTPEDRQIALGMLESFVEKELGQEDDAAYDLFYDQWHDRLDELDPAWIELSEAVFDMWLFLDYRLSGDTLVVDLLLDRIPQLDSGVLQYLKLLRDTALRLYEVVDVLPGKSLTLRDVHSGAKVTVLERLGSRSLTRHALVAARVIARGPSGQPEIETGFLHIPDLIRDQTISQLSSHRKNYQREHPRAGETAFLKEMGPFFHDAWMSCILDPPIPHLTNTDGEDLVITVTQFEVLDSAGLTAALNSAKKLEQEEDGAAWIWSGKNQKGKLVTLGRLVLKGEILSLECNSVRRGERGRALLDRLAAGMICHRSTTHENVEMKLRERLRAGRSDSSPAAQEDLPYEVKEALTLDAQARYYRKWLDETIPALDGHTPREAAADATLRPKLIDLIHGLEGMYHKALKNGDPAYDPSWMWSELGLEDGSRPTYIPSLAHERIVSMVPGLGKLCRGIAEQLRQQPAFDDRSSILTAEDIRTNLEIQRFLRENRSLQIEDQDRIMPGADILTAHIEIMINFELHRRKTFWVDESLAYMLAKTDLEVPGSDLRVPFACFALVFTDRYVLSLAERMLSADPKSPVSGHFLRVATVYLREERHVANRVLRVWFVFDALGADPPHLLAHEIQLDDDSLIRPLPENSGLTVVTGLDVSDANPLRALLHVVLNAVLYAVSPGVERQHRKSPSGVQSKKAKSELRAPVFSSEDVFFLPGAIEISHLRNLQQLERLPSGRTMLHRYMVRGHWRRAAPGWRDQRMRWIAPYWKGPDIAAVIERTYKLKP